MMEYLVMMLFVFLFLSAAFLGIEKVLVTTFERTVFVWSLPFP